MIEKLACFVNFILLLVLVSNISGDLVAHYSFETDAREIAGYPSGPYDGKLMEDAKVVDGTLFLDGLGDYVEIGKTFNLNSNTVTFSAWVMRDGDQIAYSGIFYQQDGTTTSGLNFKSDNQVGYHWKGEQATYDFDSGLVVPDNTWTFCAVVVEPTQAVFYMYPLGGSMSKAINSYSHLPEAFDGSTRIGAALFDRYVKGSIDDVRFYNEALCENKIYKLAGMKPPAVDQLTQIDLRQVQVGGEIGRRIDTLISNNLLKLDVEKEIYPKLRKKSNGGFMGLGMFIDCLVRFAAYTDDPRILELRNQVIAETLKAQEPDGYIGVFIPENRMWTLWDIHEMSYIVLGLTTDYKYFGEKSSLDAAQKLADYIINRWLAEPNRIPAGGLSVYWATCGLEESVMALFEQTQEERYLDFLVNHRKLPDWNIAPVLGRYGNGTGQHAYVYISRCVAQLQLYRTLREPRLLYATQHLMNFLTQQDGLLITGTCGYHECWHNNQQGHSKVAETCATTNLTRFLDEALRLEGDSLYGDIMERTIYNGLFAAQSPDGRQLRYYTPSEGGRGYFGAPFMCCPCNHRRIIAELPAMIYYRAGEGLAINLYTESTTTIELKDAALLKVRQETDYPSSGKVIIHLNPSKPARFPLYLRIPRWCQEAQVLVNDQVSFKSIKGGSFFEVEKQWKEGDRVELQMPMSWRLIRGRKAQAGRVAVMRGPVLFCLNPNRQDIPNLVTGEKTDPGAFKLIRFDPTMLPEGPEKDDSVRPDGMSCMVRAWHPQNYTPATADLKLRLTEFVDPGGQQTHFLLANPNADILMDDELYLGPDRDK